MRRTSFAEFRCSLSRSLEVMGDWWTMLILRDLHLGVNRFDELVEDLGISRNLLTTRLRELAGHGIVERVRYQERPVRYEYRLSEPGRELVPILFALTAWGDRWAAPDEGPPLRLRHDACGAVFTPGVTCSECGGAVTAQDVTAVPGPGGAAGPGTWVLARRLASRTA
ncbi:winged helix-turn-helix transcriptional regulator [Microbispora sp. NPDC049125]|uniref:winged helix-turn-helix transcriptional regulator n=1 Tax=Microbispora sp. NPDC049125 TaxID=3154929 RepID=UPI003465241A